MNILIVKDNIGDIYLIQSAIEEAGISCQINAINNSEIAISHIRQFGDNIVPDIIVVGMSMVKDEGMDVIAEINKNEKLKNIPLIVFTSAGIEKHKSIPGKYDRINFITKPANYQDYKKKVSIIVDFLNPGKAE